MTRILFITITLALYFNLILVDCNLTIVNLNPDETNLFQKNEIQYSAANFGQILYGKTLVSKLLIADPSDGCDELKNFNSTDSPFILLQRGNCSFVRKVRLAQLAGASLAIIYDHIEESSDNLVMMADGYSSDITIPSIIIGKLDGEKLVQLINKRTETKADKENFISMMMVFDVQKSANLNYKFFITTSNRQTFKLIREFEKYFKALEKYAKFEPHYAIWYCPGCSSDSPSTLEMCISGGKYCFPNPINATVKGRDLVLEDLKQICIYNDNSENWWRYMEKFDLDCVDYSDMNFCSKRTMNALSIDTNKIDSCIQDSFVKVGSTVNMNTDDNKILKTERELLNKYNILQWPEIIINDAMFRGNIEAESIFKAICASLKDSPSECNATKAIAADSDDGVSMGTVLLIVALAIIIIFVLMIYVYRRMLKREISQNMNTQINDMVSQYMAFYDKKDDHNK